MRMFLAWLSRQNRHRCLYSLVIFITSILLFWTGRYHLLHIYRYAVNSEYRSCVNFRHSYDAKVQTTPLYITLHRHGRLGNWLYSYASLLGIAKANGYIPYLDPYHPITYTFPISKTRQKAAKCLLTVNDPLPAGYVPEMNHLPTANISIDGYLQSWKYFRLVEQEVRREFRFPREFQSQIKATYLDYVGSFLKEGRVVISIHVRREDKLDKGFQALGFKPAPLDYFENAMEYMALKFPHCVFLIVSDGTQWCKDNLKPVTLEFLGYSEDKLDYQSVRVYKGSGESGFGLRKLGNQMIWKERVPMVFSDEYSSNMALGLLTMVNHSIISVGTFGWWGAWLANGQTVYYKDHVKPGSVLDSQTVSEDFFPPHWIPMSSSNHLSISVFFLPCFLVCYVCLIFYNYNQ